MKDYKESAVTFLGLLTILFIGLKLTNNINWNWFWVLSPVLIPAIIFAVVLIVGIIYEITTGYFDTKPKKKKEEATESITRTTPDIDANLYSSPDLVTVTDTHKNALEVAGFIFDKLPTPFNDRAYEVITITTDGSGNWVYKFEKDVFIVANNYWKYTTPIAWRELRWKHS